MSSAEEDNRNGGSTRATKRRRLAACDMCRKRKIKCDEPLAASGKCSNCTEFGWTCTYMQASKLYTTGYVEALEVKVIKLEALIKTVLPGRDFSREVGYELTKTNWMQPGVLGTSDTSDIEALSAFVSAPDSDTTEPSGCPNVFYDSTPQQPPEDHSSDDEDGDLLTKLQHLSLTGPTMVRSWGFSNYLGRSSTVGIVLVASKMLKQLRGPSEQAHFQVEIMPQWVSAYMRGQDSATTYSFPETDLMAELVNLYFRFVNIFTPILHRPTFEQGLSSGLHLRNRAFGGVTLLVCALGALLSIDQRVVIQNEDADWHSAGWAWFRQVQVMDRSFVCGEELYGLQIAALGTLFMAKSFSPVHAWMFAGFGLRLAQNVGAHKKRAYEEVVIPQDEQYRRVTWVLITLDLILSKGLGRPCNMQENEFDLEMPQCCDDEYWTHEDPQQAFQQPKDKPSYLSFFLCSIRLSQIMRLALHTIYASAKAKARQGFTKAGWLLKSVSHLDSLLNGWVNSVPEHLRRDSGLDNELHFLQSTALWMQYHEMRILIHRPFIAPFDDASKPFPSFTTCINSSRSLVGLITTLEKRLPDQMIIMPAEAICNASVISLIAIAAHRMNQTPLDVEHAKRDSTVCLNILRKKAHRWRWGARFLDLLEVLMAICDAPDTEAQLREFVSPEEVSSWHPAATGRDGDHIQSNGPSDVAGIETSQSIPNNLDLFAGLDWDWDWSLLPNMESAVPSQGAYNPFNPITTLDTMGGNHSSQPYGSGISFDARASEGSSSIQEFSTAASRTFADLSGSSWTDSTEVPFDEYSRYWPYPGGST